MMKKPPFGLLIDLDGTMYEGKRMIPFADRFIAELRRMGTPFLFVTNNSSRTPRMVVEHLGSMGIDAGEECVYTASLAAARYIVDQANGTRVSFIGEIGLETALKEAGLTIVDDAPDYVVQGIDRQFTYDKLAEAVRHIRSGSRYVLTNPDLLLPSDHGLVPGAGSISASIQAAAHCEPVVIGKPSPVIIRYALERLGMTADHVWVVGDNMMTDIGAGAASGCKTALVLTGLTTKENRAEMEAKAGICADVVLDDLTDLARFVASHAT